MKDTKQAWFKEGRYGLFIHFGLYSALAGRFNGEEVPGLGEWIMENAKIPVNAYESIADSFEPVNFDAEVWVDLAKKWGMKYIVFTSKHHDGFAMYGSEVSGYNIVKRTPFGRDMMKELAEACHKLGMPFCVYYSQAQDWHEPKAYDSSGGKRSGFQEYLNEKCLPQLKEILTGYGKVSMIWFDTPADMSLEESKMIYDFVKSLQPDCVISGRIGNNLGDYLTTDDNYLPALPYYGDWEIPATLNDTWGYKENDHNWKNAYQVILNLLRVVSRGGNYLLNIGPDCKGNIPKATISVLDKVGEWLEHHGESIYGTVAMAPYVYEVDGLIFTAKPHKLYVHLLRPSEKVHIFRLKNKVKYVTHVKSKKNIPFNRDIFCEKDSIEFAVPAELIDEMDTVFCIETEEDMPEFIPFD